MQHLIILVAAVGVAGATERYDPCADMKAVMRHGFRALKNDRTGKIECVNFIDSKSLPSFAVSLVEGHGADPNGFTRYVRAELANGDEVSIPAGEVMLAGFRAMPWCMATTTTTTTTTTITTTTTTTGGGAHPDGGSTDAFPKWAVVLVSSIVTWSLAVLYPKLPETVRTSIVTIVTTSCTAVSSRNIKLLVRSLLHCLIESDLQPENQAARRLRGRRGRRGRHRGGGQGRRLYELPPQPARHGRGRRRGGRGDDGQDRPREGGGGGGRRSQRRVKGFLI